MLEATELFHKAKHEFKDFGIKVTGLAPDLNQMLKRKDDIVSALVKGVDGLIKKNKITRYTGNARFSSPSEVIVDGPEPVLISAKNILIATGSKPATLRGVNFDGEVIGSSTEALAYSKVPSRLVVIGAGVIGLELGSVWNRLGSQVTVIEYMDRILLGLDSELATEAKKLFEAQGFEFILKAKVTSVKRTGNSAEVEYEGGQPIKADRVLISTGRLPNTDKLELHKAGIQVDEKGRIPVNARYQTKAENVYAIGDVIGGLMLAHKAEEEGIACVEGIVTGHAHVNYDAIAGVVYTSPEIATVGKSEDDLKAAGVAYKKGVFPFRANGRALAMGSAEGRIKVLSDATTDRILGVHIIGPKAGELIAEACLAISFKASAEDIMLTSHPHPTLSEAFREACFATDKRAIHI